jgi:hypothetical protein
MSYRLLRFFAGFLNVVGWLNVICFTCLGFLPWMLSTIEPMPVASRWQGLILYGAPVAGCLFGFLAGLGFFILPQIIRVFLDQRDFLERILLTNERLLEIVQSRPPGPSSSAAGLAHLEASGTEEKTL